MDDVPERAGRLLDALVAEKVMGWHPVEWSGGILVYGYQRTGGRVPKFSTDIAAAWDVVEKFEREGAFVQMARYTAAPEGSTPADLALTWRASFSRSSNPDAWGSSAPEAICRAALLAVATSPGTPQSSVGLTGGTDE